MGKVVNKVAGIPQVGDIYMKEEGTSWMIVPSNWMEERAQEGDSISYRTTGKKTPDFVGKKLNFDESNLEKILTKGTAAVGGIGAGKYVSNDNVGNIWYLEVPNQSADIEGGGPKDEFIDKKKSGTWTTTSDGDVGTWLRIKEAAYLRKMRGQSSLYEGLYEGLVGPKEVLSYKSTPAEPFANFPENTEKKPVSKEKVVGTAPKKLGIKMF